jgi:nucleoside-diphosphate-sugar epimerase
MLWRVKVLAIGATGFVGSHVVRMLAEGGHDVTILHRGKTPSIPTEHVRQIHGHRDALAERRDEIGRLAPDVVLDMIAFTGPQAAALVDVCRGSAGRLVVISSADVYRNYEGLLGKASTAPDATPLSEEGPLRGGRYPFRGLGLSFPHAEDYDKILVEENVVGQRDLPATILRLPAIYGPGDRQHRLRDYLRQMNGGHTTITLGEQQSRWRWTRGYVENVAAAVALAVTNAAASGRVYNVGDERGTSEREWLEQVGKAAGWTGAIELVPDDDLTEDVRDTDWRYHLEVDTRRIRDELGYTEIVARDSGLKRSVDWERATVEPA